MSTAEQIIAEHRLDDFDGTCFCGEWSYEDEPYDPADPELASMHSAHVVAALTNAGKTIVELPERTDDRFVDGYEGCEMDGWEVQQGPHYVSVWEQGQVQIDYQGNPEEPVSPQYARDLAAALLAAARVAEGGS
ncbi:hypothetical protein GS854_01630 [Rhodococcus hoagii]|nr:hypothetical protein [Prescottella equi]